MLTSQLSTLNSLVIILINAIGLLLAVWVYCANPRGKINQLVVGWTISTLAFTDFGYLSNLPSLSEYSLMLIKLRYAAVACFFIAGYFFFFHFPEKSARNICLGTIYTLAWVIMIYLSVFSPLLVKDIRFEPHGIDVVFGRGIMIYYLFTVLSIFFLFHILFKKYFKLSKKDKLKVQHFLIGALLFAVFHFIFNIIFPSVRESIRYYQIGDYSAIFLLGFTAFAIVKRRLFGIKVVLTELLVGLIGILLLVDFFVSKTVFEYAWKGVLFAAFLFFGILLIKSILREIKQREKLEQLTTKLETAHIKLEGAYKKLQKLDKAKSEFISIASHQLRTPLTAIKGYVSMLLEGDFGKFSKRAKKSLENVFKSNERLIELVNDLLSVSRIEAGKIEMKLAKTDLAEIIESAIKEIKSQAEKKNLFLRFVKSQRPLPKILVDKEKMKEVILNILDNAIRYTEKGGISVKVSVINSELQIAISDTGEGMSRDEIDKIFQSFSRGIAGTRFFTEGAGLGLYIASRFVKMHQGKIYAHSLGKGKGSTFYIELPLK